MVGRYIWSMTFDVPPEWLQSRREWFGKDDFDEWLEQARIQVEYYSQLWNIHAAKLLPGGALSLTLACRRKDGSEAVLKISSPWNPSPKGAECAALRIWNGQGAVKLLEANQQGDVMLLERLLPGGPMDSSMENQKACKQIAQLYTQLEEAAREAHHHQDQLPDAIQQAKNHFPLFQQVLENKGLQRELEPARLEAFETFVLDWCQGGTRTVTHGDFQNKNILLHGDHLIVIDPGPAWGDPLADLAAWALIFNPRQGVWERAEMLHQLMDLDLPRLKTRIQIQSIYSFVFHAPELRPYYKNYWLSTDQL